MNKAELSATIVLVGLFIAAVIVATVLMTQKPMAVEASEAEALFTNALPDLTTNVSALHLLGNYPMPEDVLQPGDRLEVFYTDGATNFWLYRVRDIEVDAAFIAEEN